MINRQGRGCDELWIFVPTVQDSLETLQSDTCGRQFIGACGLISTACLQTIQWFEGRAGSLEIKFVAAYWLSTVVLQTLWFDNGVDSEERLHQDARENTLQTVQSDYRTYSLVALKSDAQSDCLVILPSEARAGSFQAFQSYELSQILEDCRLSGHINCCTCVAESQTCIVSCQSIDLHSPLSTYKPVQSCPFSRRQAIGLHSLPLGHHQFPAVSVDFRFPGAKVRRVRKSKSFSTEVGLITISESSKIALSGYNQQCLQCSSKIGAEDWRNLIPLRWMLVICQMYRTIIAGWCLSVIPSIFRTRVGVGWRSVFCHRSVT